MSQLQIQWDRIRRRWVLILLIGIVAAVGALGASVLQGSAYTGRSALTIVSADRAPEQDTVLAQGYADYFNQLSSQDQLRDSAGVDDSVQLNARIAAASPIVYIEAVADTPEEASDAATKMAIALRDDVNASLGGDQQQRQLDGLNRELAAAQTAGDATVVRRLQDQISDLQGQSTNQLQDLQLNAGVVENPTNATRNAGAALVGGLLIGALLAIALGRFENRIVTANEVRDRLGLPVLATVGTARRRSSGNGRNELLRSLMGLTNAHGMPVPGSLAITGPSTTRASKTRIALSLAGLRALQGQTTLLVQTDFEVDLGGSELATKQGVADFLAERGDSRIDGKVFSDGRALLVSPPGSKRDDLFALFSKSHVSRLLAQGTTLADLVIVDAPPVETVEGQVVCSAVDRSLLVVEEGRTRARDATAALEALGQAGGTALGVVLVRHADQLRDPGFLGEGPWTPVRLPAVIPGRPGPGGGGPGPRPGGGPGGPPPQGGPGAPNGAGQVPPADRTAPISREKLEEARAAMGMSAEVANGAKSPGDVAPNGSARRGTPSAPAGKPTNGSAVEAPSQGSPSQAPAPRRSEGTSAGTPGGKPAGPDGRSASSSAGSSSAKQATGKPSAPEKAGPAAGGSAAGSTKPAGPSGSAGTSGPSAPKPSSQDAGPGVNGPTRRSSGAKPSPGPKTTSGGDGGAPAPEGSAAPGPSSASSSGPSASSSSPSSPPGARRVGIARFSGGAKGTSSAGSSSASGGSGSSSVGGSGSGRSPGAGPGDIKSPTGGSAPGPMPGEGANLSAPTVTMRTEK